MSKVQLVTQQTVRCPTNHWDQQAVFKGMFKRYYSLLKFFPKLQELCALGQTQQRDPRGSLGWSAGRARWSRRNPQDSSAELLVGLFALGKHRLHQLLRSVSDCSSQMGPLQSNQPAKSHEAANRSPERKGFLIKPQSQFEQLLTTCNCMHLTSAKLNHI